MLFQMMYDSKAVSTIVFVKILVTIRHNWSQKLASNLIFVNVSISIFSESTVDNGKRFKFLFYVYGFRGEAAILLNNQPKTLWKY